MTNIEDALRFIADSQEDIQFRQASNSMRLIIGIHWCVVQGSYTQSIIKLVETIKNENGL